MYMIFPCDINAAKFVVSHSAAMNYVKIYYGVALVSMIDKIIGLFCKRDL